MTSEIEAYFAEADRWEADRSEALAASARTAWIVAGTATTSAVAAIGAVLALTPLKQVVPFVVRVDSSTGVVDVVPKYAATEELPEAVTRHLVSDYVVHRERYVPALAESDYDQTGAYHTAAMNQAWAAAWARTNPDSPLNRYADGTRIRIQVQSVTFLKHERGAPDIVQVRFLSAGQRGDAATEQVRHYVATLQVAFGEPSSDVQLRALNPLGFKVLEYRREPEVADVSGSTASNAGASR
jgi:type IV secretion system protein VirB8